MKGSFELRWGLIIGLANMLWLYLSYFLGMHTSGIGMIQVMSLVSIVISIVGYAFALRALMKAEPETSYVEGVKSGTITAGVVALVAVIAQVIYHKLIHPGFTAYMVELTRNHFTAAGLTAEQVEQEVEQAAKAFSLGSYAGQAALGAVVIGALSCAIIMIFLRQRRNR